MAPINKNSSKSESDSGEKEITLPDSQINYQFQIDEEVYVIYRQVQHKERHYFSKILNRKALKDPNTDETIIKYFIHYKGWNHRWDIWQREELLLKNTPKNSEYSKKLESGIFDIVVESPKKIKENNNNSRPKPSPKRVISTSPLEYRNQSKARRQDMVSTTAVKLDLTERLNRKRAINTFGNSYMKDEHRLQKLPKLNKSIVDNLAYNNLKVNSVIKKCDKSEAQESFHKENDNFDVIEAPLDCDDVLRGDNFDIKLTTELMELVELEMMKMRNFMPILPCRVSIVDIFDNYIHWHLTEEILKDNGISRRTQMFNDDVMNSATRSYRICGVPLSYSQELSRAIQICQTFINLFYDSHWFNCNLLYESENHNFNKILLSAKWSDLSISSKISSTCLNKSDLKKSKTKGKSSTPKSISVPKKSTRSKALVENFSIKRSTFWFLKKSHKENFEMKQTNFFSKKNFTTLKIYFGFSTCQSSPKTKKISAF